MEVVSMNSPCAKCVVISMCKEVCPDTEKYIRNNKMIDAASGKVIGRIFHEDINSFFWRGKFKHIIGKAYL